MHPLKPHIVGKNLINLKDPNGIAVIQELINASKKHNGDFVYYSWSKPSENNKVMPKVSFAMGIPEYHWMVGGGQYISDLNEDIINRKKELEKHDTIHLFLSIIIITILITILLLIIRWWDKKVKESFNNFRESFKKTKLTKVDKNSLPFLEFKDLATEFNEMIQSKQIIQDSLTKTFNELSQVHKQLSDSIQVASYIQKSILPNRSILESFFKDNFIYYQPKDIVSGDIYLFEKISEDEIIIFNIDCTGHGVSGAFVTMLVKAIQKDMMKLHGQSQMLLIEDKQVINTSKILNILNSKLKTTLNQYNTESKTDSDVGFDGVVLYINKKEDLGILSNANSHAFVVDKNREITELKADKKSIGYKHSKFDYKFSNHFLNLSTIDTIYLTSDGFLDQLGGNKGFPFAKRRFKELISNNLNFPLEEQKNNFIQKIEKYQQNLENTDDRTIIAIKI
jgi:serine phosphatase RsbU (regulator of sigma subunit)